MHTIYLGIISIIEEINSHTLPRFCVLQFFGKVNFILNYEIRLSSVSFSVWYVLVHFWVLTLRITGSKKHSDEERRFLLSERMRLLDAVILCLKFCIILHKPLL